MKHWYVGLVVPLVAIIPLCIYSFQQKLKEKGPGRIACYLAIGLVTNFSERLLGMAHKNNLQLLHLYTIAEFLVLMWYFRSFALNRKMTVLTNILMIVFPIYCLLNMFFIQSPLIFNSYARPVSAIILMGMSFHRIFKNLEHNGSWRNYFSNWACAGLLIYFGSGLFQFALSNIIHANISLRQQFTLGSVHANLVLAMYLMFTGGYSYARRR